MVNINKIACLSKLALVCQASTVKAGDDDTQYSQYVHIY